MLVCSSHISSVSIADICFALPQEVSIFLISLTSLLQYIVQRMTYKADLQRIEKIVSEAKLAAWGPKMIPVQGSRKVCSGIHIPRCIDIDA